MAATEFESRRPAWAIRRDHQTLYTLLKGAQAVIFRYDTEAECYWRAYPTALDDSKVHIIPNGYDGAIDNFAPIGGDKCIILYTGTVSPYRYDTLLQTLRQFKKSDPARAAQVRFLFVGESTEVLAEEAANLGLSDMVETNGPISNSKVVQLQQQAHALLLIGVKPFKGYELCGSKVFSYLRAGRPILGVLPRDEVKKVLQKVGVSTLADIDSPCEIASTLRRLLDAWSAGQLASLVPDRSACEAYSAERQTAALVRALEGDPAAEPFVPGAVEIPPSLQGQIANRIRMNGNSAA
jgi:glycosyltransferase involved in cell wall biosynthesis